MPVTLAKRWNAVSLRTKITGVTVLMLTFGLIVTGIGTITVLRSYLLQQVDTQLSAAYNDISEFLGPDSSPLVLKNDDVFSAPKEYYVCLLRSDGTVVASNWGSSNEREKPVLTGLPLTPSAEVEAQRNVYVIPAENNRAEWHAIVRTIKSTDSYQTVVIAQSLENADSVTAKYFSIFLAFGAAVVLLGAMITRLLVTSTFAPLRGVERTAAAIAGGDFSKRMAEDTPNTEVGRLNRSLNTMLSRISQAFDDRSRTIQQMRRFVGDASHELRTPLVSVRGYAELYRMGALHTPEEVAKAMDRIEKEAIRMGALVEDLLELARLDETQPLEMTPLDLLPIAVDTALDARAASPQRKISIQNHAPQPREEEPLPTATIARAQKRKKKDKTEVAITPETAVGTDFSSDTTRENAPIVLANENKIRQVAANLMGNALRFTPENSPIEVAIQVDKNQKVAILDIIDHGEGIPPQIREKIFQRFWRADSSRTRETGGSGLGLAIVSSIIAAHNGTVEALETPGGGATFRVSLPLVVGDQEVVDG